MSKLKLITFPEEDFQGKVLVEVFHPGGDLEKCASGELWEETSKFLAGLSGKDGKLYVLVNALGAWEYWGSNINGDQFPEDQLNPSDPDADYGYKTFLTAGIFRHHAYNKDPAKSFGKVVFTTYNPSMHRVELVIEVDRARAAALGHQDLVDKLDSGEAPSVSMGTRVPYDLCSKCRHKSKTRDDHCIHIKEMLNKTMADGHKVGMVNIRPKFFDLSFVVIGADRTSYSMAKVARAFGGSLNSVDLAEMYGLAKVALLPELKEKLGRKQKVSEILKRIPAMSAKVLPRVTQAEPALPDALIRALGKAGLPSALTSATAAGILLRPPEYQRVVLISMGQAPLAESLHSRGVVFAQGSAADKSIQWGSPASHRPELSSLLAGAIPGRGFFAPTLGRRIIMRGACCAARPLERRATPLLCKIASGYNGYRQQVLEKIGDVVANITRADIELLSAIWDREFEGSLWEDNGVEKTSSAWPAMVIGALPLAYLYGAYQEGASDGAAEPTGLTGFVKEHPILAASVLIGLTKMGDKLKQTGLLSDAIRQIAQKV